MKTALLSFATLAALSAVASAESQTLGGPPIGKDGFIGVGGEAGRLRDLRTGVMIDGSLRVSNTPLYVHAHYGHGLSDGPDGYDQGRGGLEARACVSDPWACGFVGLDAGYQADHVVIDEFCIKGDNGGGCESAHMETFARDFLLVPRFGFEFGKHVRWRTAIELPVAMRLDMKETVQGASLTMGFGYAW